LKTFSITIDKEQMDFLVNLLYAFDNPFVRFFMPWAKDSKTHRINLMEKIASFYPAIKAYDHETTTI
jgi:hypothetical protein